MIAMRINARCYHPPPRRGELKTLTVSVSARPVLEPALSSFRGSCDDDPAKRSGLRKPRAALAGGAYSPNGGRAKHAGRETCDYQQEERDEHDQSLHGLMVHAIAPVRMMRGGQAYE